MSICLLKKIGEQVGVCERQREHNFILSDALSSVSCNIIITQNTQEIQDTYATGVGFLLFL